MSKSKLSYYELLLFSHLRENFPDKEKDTQFIRSRADLATHAYSQAIVDGYSQEGASEKANAVLFEGLHFSPYATLIEVLCNEFDEKVPAPLLRPFGLLLLVMSRALFAQYELNDAFAYTPEYEELYIELTGFIALILEKNGLQ